MKEILEFPKLLDSWTDLREYLINNGEVAETRIDFNSSWKVEPTKMSLEKLWIENETDSVTQSNWIETYFGDINIYRNNLTIELDSIQKYGNFTSNETTRRILNIYRLIARNLGQDEVIFCPDSGYPTSVVYDYTIDGLCPKEIIAKGLEKFGPIPKGISKGRRNYFFVDYVNEPIGKLNEWDDEETFWRWDENKGEYRQNRD